MKLALVNNKKSKASPGLRGICSHCNSEVIAKCGRIKIWHWSHKNKKLCDPWWENETEWHRNWKDCFPESWQEISHIDKLSGERHIADVKNPFGLVIEFQHSPIKDDERNGREKFYGNMIWIIDGMRGRNRDYFELGLSGPIQKNPLAYQVDWHSRSKLLHIWSESNVEVFIDFGTDTIWRLASFDKKKKTGIVNPMSKNVLIEACLKGSKSLDYSTK